MFGKATTSARTTSERYHTAYFRRFLDRISGNVLPPLWQHRANVLCLLPPPTPKRPVEKLHRVTDEWRCAKTLEKPRRPVCPRVCDCVCKSLLVKVEVQSIRCRRHRIGPCARTSYAHIKAVISWPRTSWLLAGRIFLSRRDANPTVGPSAACVGLPLLPQQETAFAPQESLPISTPYARVDACKLVNDYISKRVKPRPSAPGCSFTGTSGSFSPPRVRAERCRVVHRDTAVHGRW